MSYCIYLTLFIPNVPKLQFISILNRRKITKTRNWKHLVVSSRVEFMHAAKILSGIATLAGKVLGLRKLEFNTIIRRVSKGMKLLPTGF